MSSETLTPQQKCVLESMARGDSDKLIAERLGITERTVRFHVAGAIARLAALSRTHAVALAMSHGEIAPPRVAAAK